MLKTNGVFDNSEVYANPTIELNTVVLHYVGKSYEYENDPYAMMRMLQQADLSDSGDIAYNFGISQDGEIFIGRPIGVKAAATGGGISIDGEPKYQGANTGKISIVFLTNFDNIHYDGNLTPVPNRPSDQLLDATAALIRALNERYPNLINIAMHRDFVSPDCGAVTRDPGQYFTRDDFDFILRSLSDLKLIHSIGPVQPNTFLNGPDCENVSFAPPDATNTPPATSTATPSATTTPTKQP